MTQAQLRVFFISAIRTLANKKKERKIYKFITINVKIPFQNYYS